MSEDLNSRIAQSIEGVERFKTKVSDILVDMSKEAGADEEAAKAKAKNDPLNKIFDAISANIVDTIKSDTVNKALQMIEKDTSAESATAMAELLVVAMSFSAFSAVVAYDAYLDGLLTAQFNIVSDRIARTEADLAGMVLAGQELNKRIDALKKRDQDDGK